LDIKTIRDYNEPYKKTVKGALRCRKSEKLSDPKRHGQTIYIITGLTRTTSICPTQINTPSWLFSD